MAQNCVEMSVRLDNIGIEQTDGPTDLSTC